MCSDLTVIVLREFTSKFTTVDTAIAGLVHVEVMNIADGLVVNRNTNQITPNSSSATLCSKSNLTKFHQRSHSTPYYHDLGRTMRTYRPIGSNHSQNSVCNSSPSRMAVNIKIPSKCDLSC